jgi:hypothetical protein
MARCHRPAEESQRVLVLQENGAEPVRGGVALDDERLVEVREGEDGGGGDGLLESLERSGGLRRPAEPVFLGERREGRGDEAIVVDKFMVVARQTKEAADCTR